MRFNPTRQVVLLVTTQKNSGNQCIGNALVRVGANVKLLKKLGFVRESNGIVYVWTNKAADLYRARSGVEVFYLPAGKLA